VRGRAGHHGDPGSSVGTRNCPDISEERAEKICRLIMLYHLDRGWADRLAYLADIRESIHLRALGRRNPLDEFHRLAVDAFASLAADAIEAAQETFETAECPRRRTRIGPFETGVAHGDVDLHGQRPLSDDTLSTLSLRGVFR
jgi:preprotein translocase subunit SecA